MQRMTRKSIFSGAARALAALVACLGMAVPAGALELPSFPSSAAPAVITADRALWNPMPDSTAERDIVLPMPGGMAMVFRVAVVPAPRGLLWSLAFDMGVSDQPGADRALQDGTWSAMLSAPFTPADRLSTTTERGTSPVSWKASLPGGEGGWGCYLIAKYEVTRGQYRSVMEPGAAPQDDDGLPVTNVSWQDAMDFTARWTGWLLENHPDALPAFRGETTASAFVRLPTEAEWEYAARGGQNESTNYSRQPFFTMPEGRTHSDYAVMDGAPLATPGTRLPNPLGLYDTAGNAAEMTLDTFRFSRAGVLQGPSGGIVCRGGSHLSSREGILPGRRDEMPPFSAKGAAKRPDLGFRPVISGVNVPSQERREALVAEYEAMSGQKTGRQQARPKAEEEAGPMVFFGERPPAAAGQRTRKATPMEELDDLILFERDPVMRGHLVTLRARLSESNILQTRDRAARAENLLQQCIMTLESVRNIEFRSYVLRESELQGIKDILEKTKQKEVWQKKKQAKEKELRANDALLARTLASYISDMKEVSRMRGDDVRGSFQELAALYRGEDSFNRRMTRIMDMVRVHYERLAAGDGLEARAVLEELVKGG